MILAVIILAAFIPALFVLTVIFTFFALDRSPAQNEQDGQSHGDCFPFIPEIDPPFHSSGDKL